ncbi:MAG: adenine phosphoribosyltransferase [Elusimicrobiota bacterium]|jgi:adenine phosphoribosyltransferase|nr:adenine phosphoribosyltransferase [Elusimicrobiota bacterium]
MNAAILENKIKSYVKDVPDFPNKGIIFKDITPILKTIPLVDEITDAFASRYELFKIDKIAGIEARGFLFGMPLSVKMKVPFIPIRKKGKLPCDTVRSSYNLEYGATTVEMHKDALNENENVLIVDDVLATGGTVNASVDIIKQLKCRAVAAAFVLELSFLNGIENIKDKSVDIFSLAKYR